MAPPPVSQLECEEHIGTCVVILCAPLCVNDFDFPPLFTYVHSKVQRHLER